MSEWNYNDEIADVLARTLDEAASEKVIKKALNLGINFFDTANGYSAGTSEEYLGRALKKNVARDKVVIASKVYFNLGRLSSEAIHREIDGTLKRLGTDYLDLYIIHRFDYETPIEETMEALNDLIQTGKVRAIGSLPCMVISFTICSWQPETMDGHSFRPWRIIIIFCIGRMSGN